MFSGSSHGNSILSNKGVKLLWLFYNNQIMIVNKQHSISMAALTVNKASEIMFFFSQCSFNIVSY